LLYPPPHIKVSTAVAPEGMASKAGRRGERGRAIKMECQRKSEGEREREKERERESKKGRKRESARTNLRKRKKEGSRDVSGREKQTLTQINIDKRERL
jgi:hypothetical protein